MTRHLCLSRATEPFLRQMAADGRTPLSIRSYQRQLLLLTRALGDVPLSRLTPDHLNGYLTSSAVQVKTDGTPKQASTINRTKSVIRAFCRWCDQTGLIERNPAAHIRLAMTSTPVTRHMTRDEVGRFLWSIQRSRHPLAARDHALFATLAYTGIRLSGVISLRVSDIDLRHRRLVLCRTKGGRLERRHLPVRLSPILSGYLRSRPAVDANTGKSLFVTRQGRLLSPRAVQYGFAFWLRRARIRKAVSIHSLRHTFGTLLYQATKDLVLVSRALGHQDVKSTQRYAHVDDRRLVRAINGIL
ncbi:MAG: tyrosine-type recombinase/integrase [Candidatus Rokubacteria bacterium]|nr:tyrosine-type recombinase/integrase [Candidatus Rokubacteria bacterium]